jgi:regulator of extracellular matrix RemA (YlzA/DUF370 family)
MDSNHVILSSVQSDTISQRLQALQQGFHLAEYFDQHKTQTAEKI